MNCIKCGREVPEDQVFCDSCRDMMQKYPVKPGTAVQLPQRKESSAVKKNASRRRPQNTPEDQILRLKKRVRNLFILWLVTLLFLAATLYPAAEFFLGKTFHLPGQNYSTITETRPQSAQGDILP